MSPHPTGFSFFVGTPKSWGRFLIFLSLSILLMVFDTRLNALIVIRSQITILFHPLGWVADRPSVWYQNIGDYLTSQQKLLQDLHAMKEQVLFQSIELQTLSTLKNDNENLKKILGIYKDAHVQGTAVSILHSRPDVFMQKIVIGKGRSHNVQEGQVVIDASGIVGQVTRVDVYTSEVTLLTDKNFSIPVQIERNGLRAIAFGEGNNGYIQLPYLPASVDIREEDKVVTSGIDGIYPKGLQVATIEQIKIDATSPFAHIIAKPSAKIQNFDAVILLDPIHQEQKTTVKKD